MKTILIIVSIAAALSGCGELLNGQWVQSQPIVNTREYSFDAVKLISPQGGAYSQDTYTVSPQDHLLLRLEGMKDKIQDLIISDTNRVELQLSIPSADASTAAQAALKICPLARTWMMLASWQRAYPYNSSGNWTAAGGDYFSEECVTANSAANDSTDLIFDVSDWVQNEVRGRGQNFGLVVTASAPVTLVGENSRLRSPRLRWKETR